MRRAASVAAVVGLVVALFASAALAVNKQCSNSPCYGTDGADTLYERGDDRCFVDVRSGVGGGCNALFVDGVRVR